MFVGGSGDGDGGNNSATTSNANCAETDESKALPKTDTSSTSKCKKDVARLQDITKYLESAFVALGTSCSYDNIIDMIRDLRLQDDGIQMTNKVKLIALGYCKIVKDDNMLRESLAYINDKVLDDAQTSRKFAMTFAARQLDELAIGKTTLRSEMLNTLNKNYLDADLLRQENKNRYYNSIMLLGEYYHRVRLPQDTPINVLGEALLELLIKDLSDPNNANDVQLSKLILTQISLNGKILRGQRQDDLIELLYLIRKNLIEQDNLKKVVKVLNIMTLDAHYSHFCDLGNKLEGMYLKYYIMVENGEDLQDVKLEDLDDDEPKFNVQEPSNNDVNVENEQNFGEQKVQQSTASNESDIIKHGTEELNENQSQTQTQYESGVFEVKSGCNTDCALDVISNNNDTRNDAVGVDQKANGLSDYSSTNKKWSDDVWEDDVDTADDFRGSNNELHSAQKPLIRNHMDNRNKTNYNNDDNDNNDGGDMRLCNSRRSHHSGKSPRPLKQYGNNDDDVAGSVNIDGEDRDDDKKPLARWRATRFNRNNNEYKAGIETASSSHNNNNYHYKQRAISDNWADDYQYNEEGNGEGRASTAAGSSGIRLYSINDRLLYAQGKIEHNPYRYHYNALAASNWDCQSHRDDRSERSYQSNYERGHNQQQQRRLYNSNRKGNMHGNGNNSERRYNWNMYEKPPRFQKQQGSPMKTQNHNPNQSNDGRTFNESWRQRPNIYHNDNDSKMGQSYSFESGAQTLPRPSKSKNENNYDTKDNNGRSYSPGFFEPSNSQQQGRRRKMGNFFGNRYSSQSSLNSESANTNQPYHYWQHKQQKEHQNDGDVNDKTNEGELLCNAARQTTKYMKYLSTKK